MSNNVPYVQSYVSIYKLIAALTKYVFNDGLQVAIPIDLNGISTDIFLHNELPNDSHIPLHRDFPNDLHNGLHNGLRNGLHNGLHNG